MPTLFENPPHKCFFQVRPSPHLFLVFKCHHCKKYMYITKAPLYAMLLNPLNRGTPIEYRGGISFADLQENVEKLRDALAPTHELTPYSIHLYPPATRWEQLKLELKEWWKALW